MNDDALQKLPIHFERMSPGPSVVALPAAKFSVLPVREEEELHQCHASVIQWQVATLHAAIGLKVISEKRLYRSRFATFDEYCRFAIHRGKSYAHYLIAFAEIHSQIASTIVDIKLPSRECQTRELLQVRKEDRPAVWLRALNLSAGEVCAKTVKVARESFFAENPERNPRRRSTQIVFTAPAGRIRIHCSLNINKDVLDLLNKRAESRGIKLHLIIEEIINRTTRIPKKEVGEATPLLFDCS